jgi:hypothetical protein
MVQLINVKGSTPTSAAKNRNGRSMGNVFGSDEHEGVDEADERQLNAAKNNDIKSASDLSKNVNGSPRNKKLQSPKRVQSPKLSPSKVHRKSPKNITPTRKFVLAAKKPVNGSPLANGISPLANKSSPIFDKTTPKAKKFSPTKKGSPVPISKGANLFVNGESPIVSRGSKIINGDNKMANGGGNKRKTDTESGFGESGTEDDEQSGNNIIHYMLPHFMILFDKVA